MLASDRIYFRGFDGLRFLGTVIVILFHIERRKSALGIPSIGKYYVKSGLGQCAMTSFFVLSGFLIIYMLLKEKNSTGNIDVKSFYKKRIARIWPLYYIIFVFVLLFFDANNFISTSSLLWSDEYYRQFAIYLFHLPNFNVFFAATILPLSHLWSVGVEEQFYAFCPWIVKKNKKIIRLLIIIIISKFLLKIFIASSYRVFNFSSDTDHFLKQIEHFLFTFRIEAFSIGGISAYLFIEKKEKILNFIYQPHIQRLNIFILLITIPLGYFSESLHLLYSVNFGIIILNMAGNSKPIFLLDNKYSNYIGKISYGIYIYQIPLIIIISNIFSPFYSSNHTILWNILYLLTCVSITILVSIFSYEFIERKFLNWGRT